MRGTHFFEPPSSSKSWNSDADTHSPEKTGLSASNFWFRAGKLDAGTVRHGSPSFRVPENLVK